MNLTTLTANTHPANLSSQDWLNVILARRNARYQMVLSKITGQAAKPKQIQKEIDRLIISGGLSLEQLEELHGIIQKGCTPDDQA